MEECIMWYKVTYSMRAEAERKFTELLFSYEDKLHTSLAAELGRQKHEIIIHEIEKYSIKEGTC
jgi:hypothetical protein